MAQPNLENQADNISLNLRVKPLCKPDVQLKKSRQRIFNEHSINLSYSFGYQCSFGTNLSILKDNVIIIISGNYLNFLNTDTMSESFLPSTFGAGFSCTSVHPSTFYFAAAEKGPKFCINIVSYPALDICKTLRNESTVMSCCSMQFHPQGDLLVTLSHDPENRVSIWYWNLEAMLYASEDSARTVYNMQFSTYEEDVFMVSGEGHVIFWSVTSIRDDRDIITEIEVTQTEELCTEPSKLEIYCTVSVADNFLSAITDGYLLLWNSAALCFEETVKIAMPDDKPCHESCINHILIQNNYIITFGSDGYIKFWDYNEIIGAVSNAESEVESKTEEDDDEQNHSGDKNEKDDFVLGAKTEIVYINPVKEFFISGTSDLIYGTIMYVKYDVTRYLIQDKNGALYQADITSDLSHIYLTQLLSSFGCNIGLTPCPVYPYVAAASSLGSVIIYDCPTKEVFKRGNFSVPVTCILWPSAKVDLHALSLLVGFADGTLRWIAFANDINNYILKFVIKPHINDIKFLKMNDDGNILISQGLDSKLFFYSVGNFLLIPLGFYINRHEVVDFAWLKYSDSSNVEYKETLLVFCKYSYLIETKIPDPAEFKNFTELKKTYFIENNQYQVYKINGLRKYHELGDRIHDSDCEEQSGLNEAGKEVLRKLKYEEKKERRENHRFNLGLSGPITPPEILSYLPSLHSNCIWLSLGKEDFGYIFEFEFQGQFVNEPIELIPVRALEILTAETIPVLAMQYSPCGKFIFMGLQDGSLNICYLENAFMPDSGYDFAHYQIHDSDVGAVNHVAVSPDGSFITTAGCDGNVLLFSFNLFDYKNIEEYGEKPTLSDTNEVDDISSEKLSLEDELKRELDEKYQDMKEQRKCSLETLKDEYLVLMEEFTDYSNLCNESLVKLNSIPEELKIKPENFSVPSVAVEMFFETTRIQIQDVSKEFQKDLLKATLLYEKFFKCFKSKIKCEKFSINCINENITVSTFRGCAIPQNIEGFQLMSYPKMYKPIKTNKGLTDERKKKEKINEEKLKLEQELAQTQKAIIDYPNDTPVSEVISKYNQRKEQHIEKLKEHIRGYEILEKVSISDKMILETTQEIEASYFKFKDSKDIDKYDAEFTCTFAEKKATTILYYLKAFKLWTFFNSLVYSANEKKTLIGENENTDCKVKESESGRLSMKKNKHIYFKRGKKSSTSKNFAKVKWIYEEEVFYDEIKAKESFLLETRAEKIKKQRRIYNDFLSILSAAKSKLSCEKKFHDMRFNLKCIELNIFKTELKSEKKWLKIIKELEDQLYEENQELSALEEKVQALRDRRQLKKVEWMNIYKQFQKTIGLKHKHKGYLKKLFKKKIRTDEEKVPHKRHPSSESSESEVNIDSDDDSQNVDKKDIDQNLLKEVMYFRLKRHEVEKRMKDFKRNILTYSAKEASLQRRVQRVKDSLGEAWNELRSIPVNRKLEWEYITWPAVLYPENVHKEFYEKEMSSVENIKRLAYKEMSLIHETITKELKPIKKLIGVALVLVTDIVIRAELNDLIDIAYVFFSLVDKVSKEVDEYFEKLTSPDVVDVSQEETKLEKEPVNIIREILSAASGKPDIKLQPSINLDSVKGDLFESEETQSREKIDEILKENPDEMIDFENVRTNIIRGDKIQTMKSWRDVPDDDDSIAPFDDRMSELDINSIIFHSVPILDCSLLVEESYSSSEDYYMQELDLDHNVCNQDDSVLETEQNFTDYAKALIELDIQEVVEDMVSSISEKELINGWKKPFSDNFPTHPGGGLVLSKDVLFSMEKEDPDGFPYSNFYQEQVFTEESVEKPKVVHIVPSHKDSELMYHMPLGLLEDFILLNMKDVLNSLNAYHHIKVITSELEEQKKLLEKKLLKAKTKRVNAEQELVAVMRERTEEIHTKFSRMVNLQLLIDVIENPHLRIKKYETDLKIESLKNDLKKLKAAEVTALKSLDKFGFEDTVICHELLELRNEYKFLNKKYSSKLKNIPVTGRNSSATTE